MFYTVIIDFAASQVSSYFLFKEDECSADRNIPVMQINLCKGRKSTDGNRTHAGGQDHINPGRRCIIGEC